jgi:hypothetical protein
MNIKQDEVDLDYEHIESAKFCNGLNLYRCYFVIKKKVSGFRILCFLRNRGLSSLSYFSISVLMLNGLPSVNIFLGILFFHFRRKGNSSFSSLNSSGSISGISSRIGYQREHLGHMITPATISSFSSNTCNSRG